MILSNCTITCPEVSRGRSLQGRNAPPPKTDPRPIRVYKLQCDVEKRKTKEIDLGAHLMRIIIRKALRRVALVYLVCRQFVTLTSVISNWQYISLSAN